MANFVATIRVLPGQTRWRAEEVPHITADALFTFEPEPDPVLLRIALRRVTPTEWRQGLAGKRLTAGEVTGLNCLCKAAGLPDLPDALTHSRWGEYLEVCNRDAESRGWVVCLMPPADPHRDERLAWAIAAQEHRKLLRALLDSGEIQARMAATLVPAPPGRIALDHLVLTRAALEQFAEKLAMQVLDETHARPVAVDLAPTDKAHQNADAPATYSMPMFARLEPQTSAFEGGRLADSDPPLSLDEAAEMASVHAGRTVRPEDFLRAGSRGEIRLHARVPRDATLLPTRDVDKESVRAVAGGWSPLPANAIGALALAGETEWRGIQDMEPCEAFGGLPAFFDRWRLAAGEPSFRVTIANVRVAARDLHALADAFRTAPESIPPAPPAGEPLPDAPVKGTWKKWTVDRLAELKAYRAKHGTKAAAERFGVTTTRVRALLPTGKPARKGYSAFTHRPE
jgi:hypothetical protein